VKEAAVTTKSGQGKNGKPYTIREQNAWLHTGKAYPQEVRIRLGDDGAPFAPGEYELTDRCFWVDRWGSVNVDLAHMVRCAPKVAAARVNG
jgi:hypothetical protein